MLKDNITDQDYLNFIKEIKQRIQLAKRKAVVSVNRKLITLYFEIGKAIVQKQETFGWGKSVVEQMANDLQREFGKRSGFSSQNLWYMRQFYITYKDKPNLQPLVGEIPWGHNIYIFGKCKDIKEQEYYIQNTFEYGWSRDVLMHQIKTDLFRRDTQVIKQHNFDTTLSSNLSTIADDMVKSEYNLEFLGISKEVHKRELESSIIENIKKFLLELGYGFSFIDNQYKLGLGEKEYFVDLLFFHRKLNALVAIELKVGEFKPEYAGKMNFYLNLLNDTVKMPHENPAIGIILCTDKDSLEVEYAIKGLDKPMGISTYTIKKELPKELDGLLPTESELEKTLISPDKKNHIQKKE